MKEKKFSKLLRAFRERVGLKQTDIADALGTKRQYASHLEKGRVLAPNIDVCNKLADVLSLTLRERGNLIEAAMREREGANYNLLLEHVKERSREERQPREVSSHVSDQVVVTQLEEEFGKHRLPLLSLELQCGKMEEAVDEVVDWIPVPREEFSNMRYFVRAKGDSMAPTIEDGELVLIDRSLRPETGDVVVAVSGSRYSLKRFYDAGRKGIELRSDNPAHPTMLISGRDELEVRGVAIKVFKSLK